MTTIIIAGITRSGMTATMQMINAGGYGCLGEYPAFENYQLSCIPWDECKGKAVKIVDTHNFFPPANRDYKVILLQRDIKQQAKSMNKFLKGCGFDMKVNNKILRKSIKNDYNKILAWAKKYELLKLNFENIIDHPDSTAVKISEFIGGDMDVKKMSDVIIKRSSDCGNELLELSMIG